MNLIIKRCAWCGDDPIYQAYHDHEWGVPCHDDDKLFAMLCLEGMQAGLSWITILKKREAYYEAFDGFDAVKIAQYDSRKVDELMNNEGIIRHRLKIEAIISNAKAYLKIKQNQSFNDYVWGIVANHQSQTPLINRPKDINDIPTQTQASQALSKQLKKDGFKFVGPTICYAYMQACGMVDDHVIDCTYKRKQR
ncbi:DNA-3-methyladenine glycosylase I [Moraxella bovoculi]|uniref:DNA-3-methyladenine glycosylase I n=1 Tax=Moraxella bovoculi TaxID=386891 RepID=UPI00156EAB18|nr:DNA-3-methyladenine glycosylase I [Moraxella bovoculi]NSM11426.1 DNA-3-methyladenine glycosylase I [Moraxella bovoculi]